MSGSLTQSIIRSLSVGALVLGLSVPALAAPPTSLPPPAGPIEDLQATLGIILDRLNDLEGKVDALPGALGPCEVPPVWGQTYATADRFVAVLGGAAFCDKATGLVWDGSPEPATRASWQNAIFHCTSRTVGGVRGFHLPMIEQLTSLSPLRATDLNSATGDGPFSNVQVGYWSATTNADNPGGAWEAAFGSGIVGTFNKGSGLNHAWCVRGGQAYDGQDVQEVIETLP